MQLDTCLLRTDTENIILKVYREAFFVNEIKLLIQLGRASCGDYDDGLKPAPIPESHCRANYRQIFLATTWIQNVAGHSGMLNFILDTINPADSSIIYPFHYR